METNNQDGSPQDVLQRVGGRKFVLALILVVAIVALASLAPTALTTEVVVGLLGVLATFSGSNAFLSRLAIGKAPKAVAAVEEQPQEPTDMPEAVGQDSVAQDTEMRLTSLEQRVSQNESNTSQIIEILKEMQSKIFTLTQGK